MPAIAHSSSTSPPGARETPMPPISGPPASMIWPPRLSQSISTSLSGQRRRRTTGRSVRYRALRSARGVSPSSMATSAPSANPSPTLRDLFATPGDAHLTLGSFEGSGGCPRNRPLILVAGRSPAHSKGEIRGPHRALADLQRELPSMLGRGAVKS